MRTGLTAKNIRGLKDIYEKIEKLEEEIENIKENMLIKEEFSGSSIKVYKWLSINYTNLK